MQITVLASSSKGNSIQIDDGTTRLLLDAGLPLPEIRRRLNFNTASLSGALISHSHADHSKAVKDMLGAGIDCYMTKETARELCLGEHHRLKELRDMVPVPVGSWSVMPFEVVHDVANMGFVCRSGQEAVLYCTDTSYIKYRFIGLTHILIECNWSKHTLAPDLEPTVKQRLYRNHFSLENVLKFLQANDLSLVREIHLLHLSSGNSDEVLFKREVEKATGKPVYVADE